MQCVRPAGCDRSNFNATDANTFVFILEDDLNSQVALTNGSPLMSGQWVRGSQAATFTWNEQGSGLLYERIRIDGAQRWEINHWATGECNLGNTQSNGEFGRVFQPCVTASNIEAEQEVTGRLAEARSDDALSAWNANWNREERQRSSIYTTAETIIGAFTDPRVLDASSGADYTPAELLDGRSNTLYLCAPAHEQERLRTVFAAMISELVSVVYEISAQTGKPIDPPLLIVLDEAANTAPTPDLDVIASTGAGQGIQLVTVFQTWRRSNRATASGRRRSSTITAPGSLPPASVTPTRSTTCAR